MFFFNYYALQYYFKSDIWSNTILLLLLLINIIAIKLFQQKTAQRAHKIVTK